MTTPEMSVILRRLDVLETKMGELARRDSVHEAFGRLQARIGELQTRIGAVENLVVRRIESMRSILHEIVRRE